jgi:hypothetical protein
MNKISILSQDFQPHLHNPNIPWFQAEWDLPRRKTLEYTSELSGGEAAEDAFRKLNIPPEELTPEEQKLVKAFQGPSLSVGDIVEVQTATEKTQLLCAPSGWLSRTLEIPTPEKETPNEESPNEEIPTFSAHGETLQIEVHLYRSGQVALQLVCEDGSPYANPSVNLPEEEPAPNEVFIKDYSENEGIADTLIQQGIGKKTGEIHLPPYGAQVAIVEITHPKLLENLQKLREKATEKTQKKPTQEGPSL